jgi:hypothetical protein
MSQPVAVLVHGKEMKQSDVSYEVNEAAPLYREKITKADKIEMTFIPACPVCKGTKRLDTSRNIVQWRKHWDANTPYGTCPECWKPEPKASPWGIQLLDDDGIVYAEETAKLLDDEEDMVLYAEFNIQDTVTLVKSRAMRRGKILCTRTLTPIHCTENDIIKMRHALVIEKCAEVEYKETDEALRNTNLRNLTLLTANSNLVRAHGHTPNVFHLFDNGDTEQLGAEIRVKFARWYPKAIWIKDDGSIRTTYDMDSALFKDIKKKSEVRDLAGRAMYGCEVVWALESGELVTMFCGTKSMRRAVASVKRVHGHEHMLNAVAIKSSKFQWVTVGFTPVERPSHMWQDKRIVDLDDKHLWNIIQAVKKKQWASGSPVRFNPVIETALVAEYDKRLDAGRYTKKRVKKIKKKNKKWEDENLHNGCAQHR